MGITSPGASTAPSATSQVCRQGSGAQACLNGVCGFTRVADGSWLGEQLHRSRGLVAECLHSAGASAVQPTGWHAQTPPTRPPTHPPTYPPTHLGKDEGEGVEVCLGVKLVVAHAHRAPQPGGTQHMAATHDRAGCSRCTSWHTICRCCGQAAHPLHGLSAGASIHASRQLTFGCP
jgi:hypothetical protein